MHFFSRSNVILLTSVATEITAELLLHDLPVMRRLHHRSVLLQTQSVCACTFVALKTVFVGVKI